MGFTYDEVEDLRIAIDELCFSLVGRSGRPGTVSISYLMGDDGLTVRGAGHFTDGADEQPRLSPMSLQILKAVTDECEVQGGAGGPSFRLLKRRKA